MKYVIDASVAASWYLPRQQSRRARRLLVERAGAQWIAPHCFAYEVPNLLLREARKGVLRAGEPARLSLELLQQLRIEVKPPPDTRLLMLGLDLAAAHRLSLYDGLYLVCAIGFEATLASRDQALLGAAEAMGCSIYDASDHDH